MERKLASIRKIITIEPIEGADLIEVATVNSWKVVVKKNDFKVDDLVIYCEIDSLLPIREEFEFLRKSSYKKQSDGTEGFRLKTIKLRGQISQGLILPLFALGEEYVSDKLYPYVMFGDESVIGTDLTEELGIIKYDPAIPAVLSGLAKGNFPVELVKKTDEERVQNLKQRDWIDMKKHTYYITEKLDGSSATFIYHNGEFRVCSRNLELAETEGNTYWRVARELDLENKIKTLLPNENSIALQGELIGEGIQGNPYKIKGQTVRFFNIYNIEAQEYYNLTIFRYLLNKLGLESVPIISAEAYLPNTIDELVEGVNGIKSQLNKDAEAEGHVIRSLDMKISFKVINNNFLLNEK